MPEKETTVPTCRDTMIYPDRAPLLLKKDPERITTGHTPSLALIQDPWEDGRHSKLTPNNSGKLYAHGDAEPFPLVTLSTESTVLDVGGMPQVPPTCW